MSNENNSIKKKVVSGLFWSYGERITAQGVSFIVSIVLARLLVPDDFGALSLVTVLINLLNTVSASGFGNALIQKKESDQKDFSSVFWFSLILSFVFLSIVWIFAPEISVFLGNQKLIWVLRIMALRLPISSINSIQHAYIQKRMEFKKFFFSTLIGTIISAVVGIYLAYKGYGVWALVAQYMTNSIIDTIVVFITSRWAPSFSFSTNRLFPLIKFGAKIMGASIIESLTIEVRSLIIGKRYSPANLAFYERGQRFPQLIITNISVVLAKVIFPAFSLYGDDNQAMKAMMRKSIQLSMYFIAPLMFGMIAISDTMISVLMTDKWLPAVPFLCILCIYYLLYPICSISAQMVKAKGLGNIYFYTGLVRCAVEIVLLCISVFVFNNVIYIAISAVASIAISCMICMYVNRKHLDYKYREQLYDIVPAVCLSIIMLVVCRLVLNIGIDNKIILLLLQCLAGILSYFILSIITKNSTMSYILKSVKKKS